MRNSGGAFPALAREIFETLSELFPVCCASDEFYFFPQVAGKERNWSSWDDFSDTSLQHLSGKLSGWQEDLLSVSDPDMSREAVTDVSLLKHLCGTLREQLTDVAFHRSQPTFYLSVANIGIAEAIESGEKEALIERASTLSDFLLMGIDNLKVVPEVYRDRGAEMVDRTREWFQALAQGERSIFPALDAVVKYGDLLGKIPVKSDFMLPEDVFSRIVDKHMGCDMRIEQILAELEEEARRMKELIDEVSDAMSPGRAWRDVYENMPRQAVGEGSLPGIFGKQIDELMAHCLAEKMLSPELAQACPVTIAHVPKSLSAIRSADSYSTMPGYPPVGGTFYIFDEGNSERSASGLHPEYRMTAAHETWPGHHLLDISRWNQGNPLRRPLERPLFYEGWACFAEQLMFETGYFSGQQDLLILAKRRMRHALRGTVDISLHTGRMDLPAAARTLLVAGYSRKLAVKTAHKYTLHPGYQVCYTIGLRRFQSLYDRFGKDDVSGFVSKVLAQGEIPFSDLEQVFTVES